MTQRHRDIYDDPSIGGDNPGLEFDQHLDKVGPKQIWVAALGDQIVGFVSLIHDDQQAEVEPIVISSEHRSQGIGQKLLNHAIKQAKQAGVICLSVKPVARNKEAISFFYNAGFKTMGHIQLFMWLDSSVPGQWKPGPEIFGKPFDF
jgi:ribosomal protein S18 acetylase RimI-like enzyme